MSCKEGKVWKKGNAKETAGERIYYKYSHLHAKKKRINRKGCKIGQTSKGKDVKSFTRYSGS